MNNPTQQDKTESLAGNRLYTDFYKLILSEVLELPTIPEFADKIRNTINQRNANRSIVNSVLQLDPVITAQLIRKANCLPQDKEIACCSGALTRIGVKGTKKFISEFTKTSVFTAESPLIARRLRKLWKHSIYVAAISAILAQKTPGFNPDRAMLAGLVHNIGIIPILVVADQIQDPLLSAEDIDYSIKMLKIEIGIKIMREWGFPSDFKNIISQSGEWYLDIANQPDYTDIVNIAQLHSYIGTPKMKDLPKLDELPGYKKLAAGQLNAETSIDIIESAKQEIQHIQSLLA